MADDGSADATDPDGTETSGRVQTLGFVCVRNAGRSQMAAAFATRELRRRGLSDRIVVVTGGTRPADAVHDGVRAVMAEVGIDLDREPRAITDDELAACDVVATMGCSTLTLGETGTTDLREWDLPDPGEADRPAVREIRDEIERRVVALIDELDGR